MLWWRAFIDSVCPIHSTIIHHPTEHDDRIIGYTSPCNHMGATMSESIVMTETVTAQILEQVYQAGALRLALLAHGAKDVVHVQRASAPDWIVRIYPVSDPAPPHDRVTALAQLLVFLEQHQYPAERVVRTIDGKLTSRIDACHVLVTTYLGSPLQVWQPASTRLADPRLIRAGSSNRDPRDLSRGIRTPD